jgi:integrase
MVDLLFSGYVRGSNGSILEGSVVSSPGHQTRNAPQKRISGHKKDTKLTVILETKYRLAKLADRGGDLTKEWYVYYWVLNPDTQRLERIRIKAEINRFKKAIERKKLAATLIAAINKLLLSGWSPFTNDYVATNQLTIHGVLQRSIELKAGTVTKKTLSEYQIAIKKLVNFLERKKIAHMPCGYLTSAHLLQLRDELVAKGLAAKTINTSITHLRTLWNAAVERGDVTANPFKAVKDLREVQSDKNVPLNEEELARVSQHLQAVHPGLLLLCRFIYGSAVRPKECLSIQRKHIDFEQGILRIPGTISKNSKSEVVDLPEEILNQLRELSFQNADAETLLFTGPQLQPGTKIYHRNRVSELWKLHVRTELGIDKDMYSLKHRGAIDLVNAGVDIKKIQVYMRHSSLEITDQYLRTLTGQRLDAVRKRKLAL